MLIAVLSYVNIIYLLQSLFMPILKQKKYIR